MILTVQYSEFERTVSTVIMTISDLSLGGRGTVFLFNPVITLSVPGLGGRGGGDFL